MYKIGKSLGLLLLIIIIGAILGGMISEIIGLVLPEGEIRQLFLKGPSLALAPSTWNLIVLPVVIPFIIPEITSNLSGSFLEVVSSLIPGLRRSSSS